MDPECDTACGLPQDPPTRKEISRSFHGKEIHKVLRWSRGSGGFPQIASVQPVMIFPVRIQGPRHQVRVILRAAGPLEDPFQVGVPPRHPMAIGLRRVDLKHAKRISIHYYHLLLIGTEDHVVK